MYQEKHDNIISALGGLDSFLELMGVIKELKADVEKTVQENEELKRELALWKVAYGKADAVANAVKDATNGHTLKVLFDLDDQVDRKFESVRGKWDYSGKYGDGFKEALLVVRSMIHAAKERERPRDPD